MVHAYFILIIRVFLFFFTFLTQFRELNFSRNIQFLVNKYSIFVGYFIFFFVAGRPATSELFVARRVSREYENFPKIIREKYMRTERKTNGNYNESKKTVSDVENASVFFLLRNTKKNNIVSRIYNYM